MFSEVVNMIPILVIVMVLNTLCGVYNKIGIEKITFDCKIFINGLIKSLIVFVSLIGLAYCCDKVDFMNLETTPLVMIKGAIVGYGAKVGVSIFNILKSNVSDVVTENIEDNINVG